MHPLARRLPETLFDAEVNGQETRLHQALSRSAGHFAARCARVSSERTTNTLLWTPAAQDFLRGGELSEQSW